VIRSTNLMQLPRALLGVGLSLALQERRVVLGVQRQLTGRKKKPQGLEVSVSA
jgi:hypothetical protein